MIIIIASYLRVPRTPSNWNDAEISHSCISQEMNKKSLTSEIKYKVLSSYKCGRAYSYPFYVAPCQFFSFLNAMHAAGTHIA